MRLERDARTALRGRQSPISSLCWTSSYLKLHHLVQQNQNRREMGKVSCTTASHVSIAALVQPREIREPYPRRETDSTPSWRIDTRTNEIKQEEACRCPQPPGSPGGGRRGVRRGRWSSFDLSFNRVVRRVASRRSEAPAVNGLSTESVVVGNDCRRQRCQGLEMVRRGWECRLR